MSTRRARVDALTDDVTTLAEKVQALHDDLERALEEAAEETAADEEADAGSAVADRERIPTETESDTKHARADGGNVGWEEIETAGPDGAEAAEQVEWTPVDLE